MDDYKSNPSHIANIIADDPTSIIEEMASVDNGSFRFSYPAKLSSDEIDEIETLFALMVKRWRRWVSYHVAEQPSQEAAQAAEQ